MHGTPRPHTMGGHVLPIVVPNVPPNFPEVDLEDATGRRRRFDDYLTQVDAYVNTLDHEVQNYDVQINHIMGERDQALATASRTADQPAAEQAYQRALSGQQRLAEINNMRATKIRVQRAYHEKVMMVAVLQARDNLFKGEDANLRFFEQLRLNATQRMMEREEALARVEQFQRTLTPQAIADQAKAWQGRGINLAVPSPVVLSQPQMPIKILVNDSLKQSLQANAGGGWNHEQQNGPQVIFHLPANDETKLIIDTAQNNVTLRYTALNKDEAIRKFADAIVVMMQANPQGIFTVNQGSVEDQRTLYQLLQGRINVQLGNEPAALIGGVVQPQPALGQPPGSQPVPQQRSHMLPLDQRGTPPAVWPRNAMPQGDAPAPQPIPVAPAPQSGHNPFG